MTVRRIDEWQRDPWLVLRIRSHHENFVEQSLQQKEINAYLPRHRVVHRLRVRRTTLVVPLFQGTCSFNRDRISSKRFVAFAAPAGLS